LIPASCDVVIDRLKLHGIKWKRCEARELTLEMYRIEDAVEDENQQMKPLKDVCKRQTKQKQYKNVSKGSVFISTDQPLGDLAMTLLEPLSKILFRWGFSLSFKEQNI
jgi:hypothetical protein